MDCLGYVKGILLMVFNVDVLVFFLDFVEWLMMIDMMGNMIYDSVYFIMVDMVGMLGMNFNKMDYSVMGYGVMVMGYGVMVMEYSKYGMIKNLLVVVSIKVCYVKIEYGVFVDMCVDMFRINFDDFGIGLCKNGCCVLIFVDLYFFEGIIN